MKKTIIFITTVTLALGATVFSSGLKGQGSIEYLRQENLRLHIENDSLTRVIARLQGVDVSTWDFLSGMETEDDINAIFSTAPVTESGSAHGEFMNRIRRSAPSVASTYDGSIETMVSTYLGPRRKSLPSVFGRYELYLPLFKAIFDKYGIPEELISLCIVESAVSRKAVSPAGAVGIWQLMPETARRYGLRVGEDVDERYDVVLSTEAAAQFLHEVHKGFGRWDLTILAYNCGSARVRKALFQGNGETDVWKIARTLPSETKSYLPAFLAARYVYASRNELGIDVRHQKGFPKTKSITAEANTTIQNVSLLTGVSEEIIRSLNPKLVSGNIPKGTIYILPA